MMLAAAKVCSHRDNLILKTLWGTGMRVHELLHIRLQDIEAHNNTLPSAGYGRTRSEEVAAIVGAQQSGNDIRVPPV
jgi:site-specific recombinase XerD